MRENVCDSMCDQQIKSEGASESKRNTADD